MDEHRAKSVLLRLVLGGLLAMVSIGCSIQQAHTCCPIYPPSHYRLTKEAVRVPPCGPDGLYHGYKKTVWKTWPEGWDQFAPTNCPEDTPIEVIEAPTAAPADAEKAEVDQDGSDQSSELPSELPSQEPSELPALEPTQNGLEEAEGFLAPEPPNTLDLPATDGALRRSNGESRVVRTSWEQEFESNVAATAPSASEEIRRLPPISE